MRRLGIIGLTGMVLTAGVAGVRAQAQTPAPAQTPPAASGAAAGCSIEGVLTAGGRALPGAAVTAFLGDQEIGATSTDVDGSFTLRLPASAGAASSNAASTNAASAGRAFTVKADLPGFAPLSREVTLDASSCRAKVEASLSLASRAPAPAAATTAAAATAAASNQTKPAAGASASKPESQTANPNGAPNGNGNTPQSFKAPPMARRGSGAGANGNNANGNAAGANGRGANRQGFQSVDIAANTGALQRMQQEGGDAEQQSAEASAILPPGFSTDAIAGDSVTTFGRSGRVDQADVLRDRLEGRFGPEGEPPPGLAMGMQGGGPGMAFGGGGGFGGPLGGFGGGPGGFGGPGGGPGGPGGGPGMMLAGRAFGGRQGANRIRGSAYYQFGGSALDADPYQLTGHDVSTSSYFKQRFGLTFGGPFKLPGTSLKGDKTTFFLNYNANHSSSPFDSYATVPTEAARGGDFSAFDRALIDPLTGAAFAGNVIPASRINPASQSLLALIPLPNLPGTQQNFHYSTTTITNQDNVSFRLIQRFGDTTRRRNGRGGANAGGAGAAGGRQAGGGGGFGGPGGGRGGMGGGGVTLNAGLNFSRSTGNITNAFPTLGGTRETKSWDVPVQLSFVAHNWVNNFHVRFNRNQSDTQNLFAFSRDVAGDAGIQGVATDPFDWGAPNLSFSTLTSLRDVSPSHSVNQLFEISHTVVRTFKRQHTLRFGGLFRQNSFDSQTSSSARGSFVFTGLYTQDGSALRSQAGGADFADFLLGDAQQANVAFGPGRLQFHGRAFSLFAQDDWRMRGNLTLNAGVRYEYVSPMTEANNHLVNLDIAPDLSSVALVEAGQSGPYFGSVPDSLVRPDWNNIAPRIGLAWQVRPGTIVRTGYGINYTSNVYASIARQLATQPPFAVTATSLGTSATAVPLTNPLLLSTTDSSITNTYAVDPNYRLGMAQIWNLDLQRTFGLFFAGVSYTGTKGSNLDLLRAPNRGADGLLVEDVPPFIFETSGADSIMHSVTFRLRRRMANGIAAGMSYTLAKAIDDASSIGGIGGGTVAQNDKDLAAERSLSTFDRRHQLTADFIYELPFGSQKRWIDRDGWLSHIVGNWQFAGNFTMSSGSPYTARVLGAIGDVAGGTYGTLRADVTGLPVSLSNPTVAAFFNTGAFAVPAPGTFGNAGRNTIEGPGIVNLDMSLMKSIALQGTQNLSIRIQATNVLNHPQFGTIDTVVNSPTFGQVISMQPMRTMQIILRYRF